MNSDSIAELLKAYDEKCNGNIQSYKKDLQKVRTGRASGSLLDSVQVDYYGARTALSHLGQVSTPEPRLIVVNVYDVSAIDAVEKAIRNSDLGFNPSREGNTLRILVPALTEETRKEIVKHLHKQAEEYKVFIRNNRRDTNEAVKKLEKVGGITQDEIKKTLEIIQKKTDSFTAMIDSLLKEKEQECMKV